MATPAEIDVLWKRLGSEGPERVLAELSGLEGISLAARTLRGIALFDAGDYQGAVAALRAVLTVEEQNPVVRSYLVLALFRAGRNREAGELLLDERTVLFPQPDFLVRFVRLFWPLRFTTTLRREIMPSTGEGLPADPFAVDYRRWQAHREEIDIELLERPERVNSVGDVISGLREISAAGGALRRATRRLASRYHRQAVRAYHGENRAMAALLFGRAHEIRPLFELYATHHAFMCLLQDGAAEAKAILAPFLVRAVGDFEKDRDASLLPLPDTIVCHAWCLHELGDHQGALEALRVIEAEGPEDFGIHFLGAVCSLMAGEEQRFEALLRVALDRYFIDTWEQFLAPFIRRVGRWLVEQGG